MKTILVIGAGTHEGVIDFIKDRLKEVKEPMTIIQDTMTSPTSNPSNMDYSNYDIPTGDYYGPSMFSDLIFPLKNYHDLLEDARYHKPEEERKLMYKGWISEKQHLRKLYIESLKFQDQAYLTIKKNKYTLKRYRKTVKTTTPIRRNKKRRRK